MSDGWILPLQFHGPGNARAETLSRGHGLRGHVNICTFLYQEKMLLFLVAP